jgi:acyl-coenzyme A synthetase/AMP-(fatty) acid ligase
MNPSLWALTAKAGLGPDRFLSGRLAQVQLSQLVTGTSLGVAVSQLRGRTVLLHAGSQLSVALALLELDGIAGRIVICPPDLALSQLPAIIQKVGADIILRDEGALLPADFNAVRVEFCGLPLAQADPPLRDRDTEWLLFTSGTTGVPKMAIHSLSGLIGPMLGPGPNNAAIWSSFYDIRRYGGLQILLRALTGGGSMLLSDAKEPLSEFLDRIGNAGVTHISGTPSHWRRMLMSPSRDKILPDYVRLSGEIADQIILDNLNAAFPSAVISHAYASTEAGVAFDVRDGLSGFPASWIGRSEDGVEMQIKDGSLHIRSSRCARGYAGEPTRDLRDADGFVDTGDIVVLRGERYFFAGRREGVINVGGLKVHPEEVEAVINLHPAVRMSRAKPKLNPITGAVVVADVVLQDSAGFATGEFQTIRGEIIQICRENLPAHKVPAILRVVPQLEMTAAGKVLRYHA